MATFVSKPKEFPREDYVWSIQLFANTEISQKFACQKLRKM